MIDERTYGPLDRALHHVAFNPSFGGIAVQRRLADLEETIFSRDMLEARYVERPVFIAGLPRAGTTLLLNLLSNVPEFATHTYRDMPFILAPMIWNRLSSPFHKPSDDRERAHGDGLTVGYDSPEAFEEVIWKTFWPEKYPSSHIDPWRSADRNEEFETFFRRHIKKMVATRAKDSRETGEAEAPYRYLSKNNANIARLGLLPEIFPSCRIVVPIRDPHSHCQSLRRQHALFSDMHERDSFAHHYMSWIGHHEFGHGLRPIRFNRIEDRARAVGEDTAGPETAEFWTNSWIDAHREIMAASAHVVLVDFATLCAQPEYSLIQLAAALELDRPRGLIDGTRQINGQAAAKTPCKSDAAADDLYAKALQHCVNRPNAQVTREANGEEPKQLSKVES